MESWPFKVVDDGNGNPKVEVDYLGGVHTFSAQEISAMVLTKVSNSRISELYGVCPHEQSTNTCFRHTDEGDR